LASIYFLNAFCIGAKSFYRDEFLKIRWIWKS